MDMDKVRDYEIFAAKQQHLSELVSEYANIMRYISENPIRWEMDGEEPF